MTIKWTIDEIHAYEKAIKVAPAQRRRAERKRQRELDKLFEKLHGTVASGKRK